MKIDGGLRKLFHTKLREGFHWQAIETGGTGKGIPDSNFCCDGIDRWVEFKYTDAFAVGLEVEQIGWHLERAARGGVTFVAVRRVHEGGVRKGDPVDELYLYQGRDVRVIKSEGLRHQPLYLGRGGPAAWDWQRVRRILTT
jgi:hypothetical protein